MNAAIAVFFGEVHGTVRFTEVKEGVRIDVDIRGVTPFYISSNPRVG